MKLKRGRNVSAPFDSSPKETYTMMPHGSAGSWGIGKNVLFVRENISDEQKQKDFETQVKQISEIQKIYYKNNYTFPQSAEVAIFDAFDTSDFNAQDKAILKNAIKNAIKTYDESGEMKQRNEARKKKEAQERAEMRKHDHEKERKAKIRAQITKRVMENKSSKNGLVQ